MVLFFEKIIRVFLAILAITNKYVLFFWILAAGGSLLGLLYAIFSVNKIHKRTYVVRILTSFVLLLGAVGFTVYLSSLSLDYQSKATEEISPYEIKLARVGPKDISLSWLTRIPTRGYIIYSASKGTSQIALTDQGLGLSFYHSIKLENIKENTIYRYSIIVDGREFSVINGRMLEFVFP